MVGETRSERLLEDGNQRSVERRTGQHHIKRRACGDPWELINLEENRGLICVIVWLPGACHCVEQHGDETRDPS